MQTGKLGSPSGLANNIAYFEYAFAWQQLLFPVRHDARVIELVSEVFALSIWSCLAGKLNAVLLLVAPPE